MGLNRRQILNGGIGAFILGVFGMKTDPRNQGQAADLQAQIADLQAQIDQLKRQSLFGGKLQIRPDGSIKLGDIPATIEDDGIHFKDAAYGDGIFFDANTPVVFSIQAYSTPTGTESLTRAKADDDNYASTRCHADTAPLVFWDAYVTQAGTLVAHLLLDLDGVRIPTGPLSLADGITAPDATNAQAKIYVDTADGDLKVKFGDGTTKTIATDTP